MSNYGSGYPSPPPYQPSPRVRFEAIGEAWQLFTEQMGIWVASIVIVMAISSAAGALLYVGGILGVFGLLGMSLSMGSSPHGGDLSPAFGLLFLIIPIMVLLLLALTSYLASGLIQMAIKQVRREPISINDIFSGGDTFLPVLGAILLIGLARMAGTLLLIIPGFIVGGLLFLVIPLIIDRKMGVLEAMSASWNALKDDLVMATLFAIVLPFVAGLGGLLCGIGSIFTMPLLYLGIAILYRDFFPSLQPVQFNPNAPYMPPQNYGYTPPSGPVYPTAPLGGYPPVADTGYSQMPPVEQPTVMASEQTPVEVADPSPPTGATYLPPLTMDLDEPYKPSPPPAETQEPPTNPPTQ